MKLKALSLAALGAAAFVMSMTPQGEIGFSQAHAQAESVRREVGLPLGDAYKLIKAGKYKEALAKVNEADAVPNRTPNENFTIEQMRMAAASGAGDADTMAKTFESLKASGKISQPNQLTMMESIAGTYLRNNNNAQALAWAQRYNKEGGNSPMMKEVLTKAQFNSGDMTAIIKDTQDQISAEEKAGRAPAQDKLFLLITAARKKGDSAVEGTATEKLLTYYPTPALWTQILGELPRKRSFSDRFQLDIYRLKLATGNVNSPEDYSEMAQLAAQAGYPEEGKQIVEKGLAAGVLGQGTQGARDKRLLDFMNRKVADAKAGEAAAEKAANSAKDGNQLVQLGLAAAYRGQAAQGISMLQDAIAKDDLKRPEDAKLYLGLAYYLGGDVAHAQAAWRTVRGSDGSADLAHLWIVVSKQAKK